MSRTDLHSTRRSEPRPTFRFALLILTALAFLTSPLFARETIVFRLGDPPAPGIQAGAKSTYLNQASPNTPAGGSPDIVVRSQSGSQNSRGLVMFDLAAAHYGAVKDAFLTLYLRTGPGVLRTYNVNRMNGFWSEPGATWNSRLSGSGAAWAVAGAGGADVNPPVDDQVVAGNTDGVFLNWGIVMSAQNFLGGTTANAGWRISDNNEDDATGRTTIFASHSDPVLANRPSLTISIVQQVQGFTAVAGNNSVSLSWEFPTVSGVFTSPTDGAVLIRKQGSPVPDDVTLTDGTAVSLCAVVEGAGATASVIVYVDSTLDTLHTDTQSCNSGAQTLTNDNTYYYKAIAKDAGNFYSTSAFGFGGSSLVPQVAAFPSAATPAATDWIIGLGGTVAAVTPPGVLPVNFAISSSTANSWIQMVSPASGRIRYPAIKLQGSIDGRARPPVIDSSDSSFGIEMMYVAATDGFLYAFNPFNGAYHFARNPTDDASPAANNNFVGGAAVVVKSFGMPGFTLDHDLVVVCTASAATNTANSIVGVRSLSAAVVWTTTGTVSGVPAMGDCFSTPLVDYINSAIFVTTNRTAGTPNLWKLDANTGAVLASTNLSGANNDITSSPTLTPFSEVLFVGDDSGNLRAVRPDTLAVIATQATGLGVLTDFPVVRNISSPWNIIFRGATGPSIRSVDFTCTTFSGNICTTGSFATNWTVVVPGATQPITSFGLVGGDKLYVGANTGTVSTTGIQQRNLTTGALESTRLIPAVPGAPSLDTVLNRLITGSSNGLLYSYSVPF